MSGAAFNRMLVDPALAHLPLITYAEPCRPACGPAPDAPGVWPPASRRARADTGDRVARAFGAPEYDDTTPAGRDAIVCRPAAFPFTVAHA